MRRSLQSGEVLLKDSDEMFFRACAPGNFNQHTGQPLDTLFRPDKRDNGELSGDRSSRHSADQAYKHRTNANGLRCSGIWGITVGEADQAGHNVVDDTSRNFALGVHCSPAHVFLDMTDYHQLRSRQRQAVRQRLLLLAIRHGRQYPVNVSEDTTEELF